MDVHVGEMNSTVRMTDSQTALAPEVFERIVAAVIERVHEARAHDERAASERRVRPGASSSPQQDWD